MYWYQKQNKQSWHNHLTFLFYYLIRYPDSGCYWSSTRCFLRRTTSFHSCHVYEKVNSILLIHIISSLSSWMTRLVGINTLQLKIKNARNLKSVYSAGMDFRRQNLTFEIDPRAVRIKIFIMAVEL